MWKFRQTADEISIDDLGDDETDFTDESSLGTPLPDTEMSFFDPLHPVPAESSSQDDGSAGVEDDAWLLSALSACAELNKDKSSSSVASQDGGGQEATGVSQASEMPSGSIDTILSESREHGATGAMDLSDITLPDRPSGGGIADDVCSNYSEASSSTWDEFDPLSKSKTSKVEIGRGDLPFSLVDKPSVSPSLGKPEVGKGDLPVGLMGSTASRLPPDGQDSNTSDANAETDKQRHQNISSFQVDSSLSGVNSVKTSTPKGSPLRFWSSTPKDSPQHGSVSSTSSPAKSPRKQLMTVDLGERGRTLYLSNTAVLDFALSLFLPFDVAVQILVEQVFAVSEEMQFMICG